MENSQTKVHTPSSAIYSTTAEQHGDGYDDQAGDSGMTESSLSPDLKAVAALTRMSSSEAETSGISKEHSLTNKNHTSETVDVNNEKTPVISSSSSFSSILAPARMYVIKRNGREEPVQFDKVTDRLRPLCQGLDERYVSPELISQKVIQGIYSGVTTSKLDELAAETAAYHSVYHPDYNLLGGRIAVSNLHKRTRDHSTFLATCEKLRGYINPKTGQYAPLIAEYVLRIAQENENAIQNVLEHSQDFQYTYFGLQTLKHSYLLQTDDEIVETPQHMLMRVAIGIHGDDLKRVEKTYKAMARGYYTHASPTMFNAGTEHPQLCSCFLMQMQDDSIEGIYGTLTWTAKTSKYAGGIGLSVSCIRAQGAYIRSTNGHSNGLVPMLQVFNATARYVDQGGGKRKGAFAIYLEPWHADVFEFLELRYNRGKEEHRARDLFTALWVPDLFMEKVKQDEYWYLFSPDEAPGLHETWGKEFEELYDRYVSEGKYKKSVKAQTLWSAIVDVQIETGTPYMLYKDAANAKSNQQNLGTIQCSNLCTEIIEYTSKDEIAVCNLASIALPKFVAGWDEEKRLYTSYNYDQLHRIVQDVTLNLNRVIDRNYYPVKEMENSNFRHRPIGIGVQGLADVFMHLGISFESDQAKQINRDIFATIYHAAVTESVREAQVDGPYETFPGSPASEGRLQPDLWNVNPDDLCSLSYDWNALRHDVKTYGMRNSLLLAPMPTASTAQILGNNESVEPYTSNMINRRVLSGEFPCINHHLVKDCVNHGIWTDQLKQKIIAGKGSVQNIHEIPRNLREIHKTAWEMSQKTIINMAVDRGAFVCQSQSLNIFMEDPTFSKVSSMHFYGWQKGLITGQYYLRTRPKADAIQFTVDPNLSSQASSFSPSKPLTKANETVDHANGNNIQCQWRPSKKNDLNEDEECLMCSS
jgi:ribonucleoside-diphosphate reductase alpha chain